MPVNCSCSCSQRWLFYGPRHIHRVDPASKGISPFTAFSPGAWGKETRGHKSCSFSGSKRKIKQILHIYICSSFCSCSAFPSLTFAASGVKNTLARVAKPWMLLLCHRIFWCTSIIDFVLKSDTYDADNTFCVIVPLPLIVQLNNIYEQELCPPGKTRPAVVSEYRLAMNWATFFIWKKKLECLSICPFHLVKAWGRLSWS